MLGDKGAETNDIW